ncbi:porin family protein [uncultured Draconibacterium sp.]|uniref:porin family protein n=1 Tax=uncultured Draconibacterium sp. TaxID=1573823 RepID=UPI00326143AE
MKQKSKFTMKLFSIVLMVGILTLGGVNKAKAQLSYGLKVNAGIACQSDLLKIADNCDIRFSPSVGLLTKYQFAEGFALKSGIDYQQKGRNFTENNQDVSNKLHYLTVPLKAEFSAGEKAGFKKGQRVFFAVGPYLSYLLDAKAEINSVSSDLDTKNFDAGLGFEMGMEFPVFNQKALQLGLNYDMGFVEVYNSTPDLHNKMTSISLGLLF